MGKKYFCEYCEKTMSAARSIIKIHNKGILHQKLVNEHYKQFKDAETILKEEGLKHPCSKFAKGECPFGTICRYSHYTSEEINNLKQIVAAKNYQEADTNQLSFQELYDKLQSDKYGYFDDKNTLVDKNGLTHILPWKYNVECERYSNLPPSLKKFQSDDFLNTSITEWG